MDVTQDREVRPVTPGDFTSQDIVIAVLQERIRNMSKDARADLASLFDDIGSCRSEEEYREIHQTLRELLFPDAVGDVTTGSAGPAAETNGLKARMVHIGRRIKNLRSERRMTQTELAEMSGLPQSHISRLEAGVHSPSFKTLAKLAKALGVNVGDIDPAN